MDVVVPFDAREPKSRLSAIFDEVERFAFARVMLEDVCEAIAATGHSPTVLATAEFDCAWPVQVDDRPLSDAVNAVIDGASGPVAVVMADLALATPEALDRVFAADGDVVLVPGLGGGTNVLLTRRPEFRVDYHEASIKDHRQAAATIGVDPTTVDSFRLALDIDEREDLVEVLLHGDGAAAAWLRDTGVALETSDGRMTASRSD